MRMDIMRSLLKRRKHESETQLNAGIIPKREVDDVPS